MLAIEITAAAETNRVYAEGIMVAKGAGFLEPYRVLGYHRDQAEVPFQAEVPPLEKCEF